MEKSEILDFVKRMKAKDHVIMFHSKPKDKHLMIRERNRFPDFVALS